MTNTDKLILPLLYRNISIDEQTDPPAVGQIRTDVNSSIVMKDWAIRNIQWEVILSLVRNTTVQNSDLTSYNPDDVKGLWGHFYHKLPCR